MTSRCGWLVVRFTHVFGNCFGCQFLIRGLWPFSLLICGLLDVGVLASCKRDFIISWKGRILLWYFWSGLFVCHFDEVRHFRLRHDFICIFYNVFWCVVWGFAQFFSKLIGFFGLIGFFSLIDFLRLNLLRLIDLHTVRHHMG